MKKFQSARFGELNYEEREVVSLSDGLIGLPDLKRWLVVDMASNVPIKWLHSLDRPDFCLPVSDPYYFCDGYEVKVPADAQAKLGVDDTEDIVLLVIATVHEGGTRITGNLLAPLLIGTKTRRGLQLPLEEDTYAIQQEMDYFKFGLATDQEAAENMTSGALGPRAEGNRTVSRDTKKVGI